jgi:quercetin dioxygenase-like cupin family protein
VKPTRRELTTLLSVLAAASTARAQPTALPSRIFPYDQLPVRVNGQNRSRAVLNGKTHSGYGIEMHETELAPGLAPHPPHKHVHEELLIVREGTMEVTILANTATLGPGSVAYIASNEEHGWRNVGSTTARYFVVTLGR